MEGKEWVWDNGLLKEKEIQELKNRLDTCNRSVLDEEILQGFHDLLMS
jgi:hypothetical protein